MVRRRAAGRSGRELGWAALVLGCAAGLTAGCLRVVKADAPWYAQGPAQVAPPDGFLKRGHHVFVLWEHDSYARFVDPNFVAGHVFAGDLVTPGAWREIQAEPAPEPVVLPPETQRMQGVGVIPE